MESNNFSDQYLYILESENVDKEIEFFWYWDEGNLKYHYKT